MAEEVPSKRQRVNNGDFDALHKEKEVLEKRLADLNAQLSPPYVNDRVQSGVMNSFDQVGERSNNPSQGPVGPEGGIIALVVFGSINVDITAMADGTWPDGDSSSQGQFMQSPGGKGANEAVAVGRLVGQSRTALVGRVGNDEPGRAYRRYLEKSCRFVDISGVRGGRKDDDVGEDRTGTAVQIITHRHRL